MSSVEPEMKTIGNFRWLPSEVFELIEYVKDNPAIYNPQDKNYFCRPFVENIWRDIDIKLKKNPGCSLAKWTNLRICFRREYATFLSDSLKPSWTFFENMFFLHPYLRKKRSNPGRLESHIQEALEQINSITRGNIKSYVENIESIESYDEPESSYTDGIEGGNGDFEQTSYGGDDDNCHHHRNNNANSNSDSDDDCVMDENMIIKEEMNDENNHRNDHDDDDDEDSDIELQYEIENSNNNSSVVIHHNNEKSPIPSSISTNAFGNRKRKHNPSIPSTSSVPATSTKNTTNKLLKADNMEISKKQYKNFESSSSSSPSNPVNFIKTNENKTIDTIMKSQKQLNLSKINDNKEINNTITDNNVIVNNNNDLCNCKLDPDAMFLMSLLPDIQSLSRRDKGKFKIEIQKLIQNFLYPEIN